ncbi:g320 [Coccomyxa viridis]|uniref:G320 protein n=1 Tax=Coccomyxa viridis TaxID=1274662 RepID=A0ABP1FFF3_9CHLO
MLQSETTFDFTGFFTYEGVQRSLATKEVVLPAWVHYVAFDLFTAKWQVQDAAANHVPHLLVIPCLFMTLLLGPAGLLCYFIVRTLVGLVRRNERSIKNE